jgi:hypothetical protein
MQLIYSTAKCIPSNMGYNYLIIFNINIVAMSPVTARFAGLSPAALKVLSRSGALPEDQEDESKSGQDKDEKESDGTAEVCGAPAEGSELRQESSFADMPRDQLADALPGADQKNGLAPQDGEPKTEEEALKESMRLSDDAPLALIAQLCAETMHLDKDDAWNYAHSLDRWRSTIRRIAELFLRLAFPAEMLFSPRYDHSAMPEGFRLHPLRINQAAIQQITRTPLAIWQPVRRSGRRQDLGFGGLDVHLLMDVSGSMEGEKARCAADAAICLIEGLQMAAYMALGSKGVKRPDLRIELIAFGAGFDVVCPLSYDPTGEQ